MKFLFFFLLMATSQTTAQNASAVVEGSVTRFNTEAGIASVEITLLPKGGTGTRFDAWTLTDNTGRFVIEDVPPGQYTLRAQRGGYLNPERNGVGIEDGGSTRTITVVAGERRVTANLTLVPGAVIAGKVLDPYGQPAVNTTVTAERLRPNPLKTAPSTARTNHRGEYRLFELPPGTYRIFATRSRDPGSVSGGGEPTRPEDSWQKTFFPGVTDPSRAVTFELEAGSVQQDTDFSIQRETTFSVSGKVVFPPGIANGPPLILFPNLLPIGSSQLQAERPRWDYAQHPDHYDFKIYAVRPGAYELIVHVGGFSPDVLSVLGRAVISVSDSDLTDLRIEAGNIEVRGQTVVTERGLKLSGTIGLQLTAGEIPTRPVKIIEPGGFTIPGVIDGRWKIVTKNLPGTVAVFEALQGNESIYEEGFIVSGGTPNTIQVIFSPAGGIDGIVRDTQQQQIAGATVILVPAAPNQSRAALYRTTTTDRAGRFKLDGVALGDYTAFAIDPEIVERSPIPGKASELRALVTPLQTQGVAVSVTSGSKPNTVTITAIGEGIPPTR